MSIADVTLVRSQPWWLRRRITATLAIAALGFLALYNLADYPLTWFDEGSHLHVPKALVRFGVYADYSSEGFRYYGPTIGVGPMVLLPIAGVFKLFGIGLLQARLVMAAYLLAAVVAFFHLAKWLGGRRLAWVATALFVSSRGVGTLEYGRQVLGEVPAFFFLATALGIWFRTWERSGWLRLSAVGLLLGLAVVTKAQFFIVLGPALALAWVANLAYYRCTPQRVFVVPGVVLGLCFVAWQVFVVVFLGPGAAGENLALHRAATASAAIVFSPELMRRAVTELLSMNVYLGWLVPPLVYGFFLCLPRRREAQWWSLLFLFVAGGLSWYVLASVSWLRYAFPALALSSVLVARFFSDLTAGYRVRVNASTGERRSLADAGLRVALLTALITMVGLPIAQTTKNLLLPSANSPSEMADYLRREIPRDALVETWEPEIGFLADHRFHYPPQIYLYRAVSHVWRHGESPAATYRFVQEKSPQYVLVGPFARWVGMYPPAILEGRYARVVSVGPYDLYRLRN